MYFGGGQAPPAGGGNRGRYATVDDRVIFERLWRGAFCQALGPKVVAQRLQTPLLPSRALTRCCCHCHCEQASDTCVIDSSKKAMRSVR